MGKLDPREQKQEIRRHFRETLERERGDDGQESDFARAHRLAEWVRLRPEISRIASFCALPQEPDLSALHELLPNHTLYYPLVVSPGVAHFHLISSPASLVEGSYGIREPDPKVHPPVSLKDLDLFLCPGLAFGKDGSRLGRGGGFYDRVLAEAQPTAPRIGIGFACQLSDTVPMETHDAWMSHRDSRDGIIAV